jgi:hypothetical protein
VEERNLVGGGFIRIEAGEHRVQRHIRHFGSVDLGDDIANGKARLLRGAAIVDFDDFAAGFVRHLHAYADAHIAAGVGLEELIVLLFGIVLRVRVVQRGNHAAHRAFHELVAVEFLIVVKVILVVNRIRKLRERGQVRAVVGVPLADNKDQRKGEHRDNHNADDNGNGC